MTYSERQVKKLGEFLLEHYPRETDEGCFKGEGFVDIAIGLLTKKKEFVLIRGECQSTEDFDRIEEMVEKI